MDNTELTAVLKTLITILGSIFFIVYFSFKDIRRDIKRLEKDVLENRGDNWENKSKINSLEYRCKNKD